MIVVTVGSLFTQGLNLGLDFEGGDAWDIPASETFGVDEASDVLSANGVSTAGARIQLRSSETADVVTVQVEVLPRETGRAGHRRLRRGGGRQHVGEISFSFTSSTWGAEITEKASSGAGDLPVRGRGVHLGAIRVAHGAWRRSRRWSTTSIVAVGVYSVFQFEVTPATVIAFLTILGYSLYDTIVVFDRVKENEGRYASTKMPYEDIVEHLDEPGDGAVVADQLLVDPARDLAADPRLGCAGRGGAA